MDATHGVLCRDYLEPIMRVRDDQIEVNTVRDGETLFLNGRLICLGGELQALLEKTEPGTIRTKGGYVVAARLSGEAANDFADYIRKRIGEEANSKLYAELRSHVRPKESAKEKPKDGVILSDQAAEGTFEDDHALGQDSLEEKLPKALTELIKKHKMKVLDGAESRLLSFPWQIIEVNPKVLEDDFQRLPFRGQSEETMVYPGVHLVAEENIVVGEAAVIKPGVILDASSGPIVIGDGTVIMPNASIIGPVYIGKNCIIKTGAKILEGTSIGHVCKIGGEVDGTIFGDYTNKQHDGFIGHSYLGEWVNIGAGANNSDLKNNYSPVKMWCAGEPRTTGRQFLGMIMGDHSKAGIGAVFNTGTVVGFNCNLYGSRMPDSFVPSFSWGEGSEIQVYQLKKAMQTAQIVLERRNVKWDEVQINLFEKIFEISEKCGRNI